jgi:hypothetical protein
MPLAQRRGEAPGTAAEVQHPASRWIAGADEQLERLLEQLAAQRVVALAMAAK